jgi:hypothetical protein
LCRVDAIIYFLSSERVNFKKVARVLQSQKKQCLLGRLEFRETDESEQKERSSFHQQSYIGKRQANSKAWLQPVWWQQVPGNEDQSVEKKKESGLKRRASE